jgi:putative N6-adenine-specific DNA methylase
MEKGMIALALCAVGLEKIAAQELTRLGFKTLGRSAGRVEFQVGEATLATDLAKANIGLRTVERVLLQLGRFEAADFDAFYEGVNSLPWETCCFKDSKLHIERVRTHDSVLSSQSSLQAMAQKAAYDRLMKITGMRSMPETGNVVAARVYMENDVCTIGVDTSGDALHKRGYRAQAVAAPLKETIAASLLFLSGWNRKYALLDPFCGSGTIAIEAALYALDFAPGLARRFAFESMPVSNPGSVVTVREEFESRIRKDVEFTIRASDADPAAVKIARSNAELAGIEDWIEFSVGKAEEVEPFSDKGYLIANPPYGNRLGTAEESHALYERLGDMRERFSNAGWGMGFITDIEDFGDYFGLKAPTARRIMNGAEEQWFHWYPAVYSQT